MKIYPTTIVRQSGGVSSANVAWTPQDTKLPQTVSLAVSADDFALDIVAPVAITTDLAQVELPDLSLVVAATVSLDAATIFLAQDIVVTLTLPQVDIDPLIPTSVAVNADYAIPDFAQSLSVLASSDFALSAPTNELVLSIALDRVVVPDLSQDITAQILADCSLTHDVVQAIVAASADFALPDLTNSLGAAVDIPEFDIALVNISLAATCSATFALVFLATATLPAGIASSADIECWGAGGGGGTGLVDGGGGGGGGGYSKKTSVTTTAGDTVTVGAASAVATAGGDTWVVTSGTVLAKGGGAGGNGSAGGQGASGTGGAAASGIGTTKFSGGNGTGGGGANTNGGGGGGGAGRANNGGNGSGTTGGAGGSTGGGAGGTGGNSITPAVAGTANAGGGGGASSTQVAAGGARGGVIVTYVAA